MTKLSLENVTHVTGLIPAAGRASRLPGISCSKELLPVPAPGNKESCPAIENSVKFLLDCGIEHQHVVIAPGKKDIPGLLGDGSSLGARISYTAISGSRGVPHSLRAGLHDIGRSNVVLVFPDIMFEPRASVARCMAGYRATECDVLLALIPSARGEKVDIVAADVNGVVTGIRPKPGAGISGWTWVAAAWSSAFSAYLQRFVDHLADPGADSQDRERYIGDVMNTAIADGLSIRAEHFRDGDMIDIGTPDDFATAWRVSGHPAPPEVAALLRSL